MLGAGEGRLKQHYYYYYYYLYFHHCSRKTVAEPVGCTLPVFVDMANFTSSAPPGSGIVFSSTTTTPGEGNKVPEEVVWPSSISKHCDLVLG